MRFIWRLLLTITALMITVQPVAAQLPQRESGGPKGEEKEPSEPGIPVKSELVKAKCSGCHKSDKSGNLTRISWERTTPEGWQQIIKRMVRLNGLALQPEEAREIVAALSETHGLAPEEAKPVAWFLEKRYIETEKPPSEAVANACGGCHALAQPQSWRRTKEEWELLVAMHRGYFPVVENTSFRRATPGGEGGPGAGAGGGGGAAARAAAAAGATGAQRPAAAAPPANAGPQANAAEPTQAVVEEWAKLQPLHSPEWASWQAARRTPRLAGRWAVSAYLPGKGKLIGEMTITAGPNDTFTTKTSLTALTTGEKIAREGKAVVYTGYAWRGRSTSGKNEEREVISFSRDQTSAEGRWFWGGYNEFGYDVTLRRAGDGPVVLTTDIDALKTGITGATVKVYGDQFAAGVTAADIDFGGGVKVTQVVSQTPSLITVKVDVDAAAITGRRDLTVRRAALPGAIAVFNKIDYIKTPPSALARLGGTSYPKGFVQFEATAWSNGLDGKPRTADDVLLGPVAAKWSMEEFPARLGDDDMEFVGSLTAEGLFTPNLEGPNERRKFGSNNFGDVWITATYLPPGAEKPLVAKSYLVVAIPQYMRYDQPEVGR